MSELSLESKELIRKYILSLVVLPAGILSIFIFAAGWFFNEGIRGSAYAKAYSEAQNTIVNIASTVSVSASEASNAKDEANELLEKVLRHSASIETNAETAEKIIRDLKGKTNIDETELAKALRNEFNDEIVGIAKGYVEGLTYKDLPVSTVAGYCKVGNYLHRGNTDKYNETLPAIAFKAGTGWSCKCESGWELVKLGGDFYKKEWDTLMYGCIKQ